MKKIVLYLKKLDWVIILTSVSLVGVGLFSIYTSSTANLVNFKKQTIFFFLGFLLMLIFSIFDWRIMKENQFFLFFLYFFSCLSLLGVLFFAPTIRGVKSWYKIGLLSFDPIEITKISLIFILARYFSKKHAEMYTSLHLLISGIYVLLPSFLIFLQPNFGSMMTLIFLWIGILVVSGVKLRHFLLLLILGIFFLSFSWKTFLKEYQKERILSFFLPKTSDPLRIGWSQTQSQIAIGSGGFWGKGIKNASQTRLGFLPEPQTDFIFSTIAEETGFIGVSFLFVLYFILLWRMLKIILLTDNNFSRLVGCGFGILIVSQIFIHIGANIGLLPVTGISLPFISYGGSSLIFNMAGLGILQSFKTHH